MEFKQVDYFIAMNFFGKPDRQPVNGFAVRTDKCPQRFAVRKEWYGDWVVDDWETGFSIARFDCDTKIQAARLAIKFINSVTPAQWAHALAKAKTTAAIAL